MEDDGGFNLRLKISKLQEELALYRNGTSSQELLDLLAEKDTEVERVHAALTEKNESLKKLAKKGAEVLARCDSLQTESGTLRKQLVSLADENKQLVAEMADLKHAHASASALCTEKDCTIEFLEAELAVRNDSIDKLQARCAELVTEKSILSKELSHDRKEHADDRAAKIKQSKELMEELERSMRFNTEVKERLNREHAHGLELSSRVSTLEVENKSLFDAKNAFAVLLDNAKSDADELRRAKAAIEADLSDAKLHLSVASSRIGRTERHDEEMKHALGAKDQEIALLKQRVVDSEATMKGQLEQAQAEVRQVEERLRREAARVGTETEEATARVRRLEEAARAQQDEAMTRIRQMEEDSRAQQEALRRDRDREYREVKQQMLYANSKELLVLQAKNQELEDKIRRQEQYMKSRLLKDRSNLQTVQSAAAAAQKMKENNLAPIPPSLQQYCYVPPQPPASIPFAVSSAMLAVTTSGSPLSRAHPHHPHHHLSSGASGSGSGSGSSVSGTGVGGVRLCTPESMSTDPSFVYRPPSARAKALAAGGVLPGAGTGATTSISTATAIVSSIR